MTDTPSDPVRATASFPASPSDTVKIPRVAKPSFLDLPATQLRIWECGAGPALLVLPGLVNSPQAICAQVSDAYPDHRIVALELPGLGASPATVGQNLQTLASMVDAVLARLENVAGCVAFDLSIPVVLRSAMARELNSRLLLVDLRKARWLARSLPDCGTLALDHDGTYLNRLWNHVRDIDMLESTEPRRPRGEGTYKTPEELDEVFLCFAVQPSAYAELWKLLAAEIGQLDDPQVSSSTIVESLSHATADLFSAPAVRFAGEPTSAPSTLKIRRGYEDMSSGRMHFRTSGSGDSCVVALLAGPFSSALLTPLLLALGDNHTIVAPDYIGQGDSCRSPEETTIARAAADIDELTRKLGWSQYSVYGTQTGAGVALEAAIAFPHRVKSVVIDSCSMQHASERIEHRIRYFPSIEPDSWGSHVFKTFNVLKDGEIFWPWYLPSSASAKESTSSGLGRLHDSVICTLRSRTTPVYRSMSSYEARKRLSEVHQPVLFVTGPKDIFKNYMPEAQKLAPDNFTFMDVPATVWAAKGDPASVAETCAIFDAFFMEND